MCTGIGGSVLTLIRESAQQANHAALERVFRLIPDEALGLTCLRSAALQQARLRSVCKGFPGGNKAKGARLLNIPRGTYYYWLNRGWSQLDAHINPHPFAALADSDLSWPKIRLMAVKEALCRQNGHRSNAARLVGLARQTVGRLVKKFPDLAPPPAPAPQRAFAFKEG